MPGFRGYVTGQSLSLIGTRSETFAQALLMLHLTPSGTVLGLAAAARYAPILLLSPYAGPLVDRHPRRHVLTATQAGLGLVSASLGASALTGNVRMWQVVALALLFGTLRWTTRPGRRSCRSCCCRPTGGCLSTGTPNGTCCWPCSSAWAWFRPRWSERAGGGLDRPARGPPPDQVGQLAGPGTGGTRAPRALLTSTGPNKPADA